ncbi:MAG: hypothetical protein ABIK92_12535 [Pseudomonadota bacterium]
MAKFKNVDVYIKQHGGKKKEEVKIIKGVAKGLGEIAKEGVKQATTGWGGIIIDQIFGGKKK